VSLGAQGALLVTKDLALKITPPAVTTLSTVGAGDSLVGGLVLSLSQGKSLTDAVMYGVACGTAATMSPGTELCRKADADKLFAAISAQMGIERATLANVYLPALSGITDKSAC